MWAKLWGRRRDPSPEITQQIEKRDALFAESAAVRGEAKELMREVDQLQRQRAMDQQGLIDDFEQAEQDRIDAKR